MQLPIKAKPVRRTQDQSRRELQGVNQGSSVTPAGCCGVQVCVPTPSGRRHLWRFPISYAGAASVASIHYAAAIALAGPVAGALAAAGFHIGAPTRDQMNGLPLRTTKEGTRC